MTLCILSKSFTYDFVWTSSWNKCVVAVHAWQACAITAPVGHFKIVDKSLLIKIYCTMGAAIFVFNKFRLQNKFDISGINGERRLMIFLCKKSV